MCKKYLIVGNGVAGTKAAQTIRKLDSTGRIVIVSNEDISCYSRPRLPEILSGKTSAGDLVLHQPSWYSDQNITLHLNTEAWEVDLKSHTLTCRDGHVFPYDRLLLACGAHCFIPPIGVGNYRNIFSLRSAHDASKIYQAAQGQKAAVLIGGGVLGLEAGYALTQLGMTVKVVEFFDRLLPRQLDNAGSDILSHQLTNMGFELHCSTTVTKICGAGRDATGVQCADGNLLNGDLILVSAGVRPNLELAREAGLTINRGVVVNQYLQTSDPDVYAAGDLIELNDQLWGQWSSAQNQGQLAGANMCSPPQAYTPKPLSVRLKVAGIELVSIGNWEPKSPECQIEVTRDPSAGVYRKLVRLNNKLVGAILLGDTSNANSITKEIK